MILLKRSKFILGSFLFEILDHFLVEGSHKVPLAPYLKSNANPH